MCSEGDNKLKCHTLALFHFGNGTTAGCCVLGRIGGVVKMNVSLGLKWELLGASQRVQLVLLKKLSTGYPSSECIFFDMRIEPSCQSTPAQRPIYKTVLLK